MALCGRIAVYAAVLLALLHHIPYALASSVSTIPLQGRPSWFGAAPAGPKAYYLSLGDSLAYGKQPDGDEEHGYSDDFYDDLSELGTTSLINMGCPSETSATFINGGCPYANLVKYSYSGPQLAAAVSFIQQHPGQVSPVTLDLGTNDLRPLFDVTTCSMTSTQAISQALSTYDANLDTIFAQLQAALGGGGDLLVMTNYFAHQNLCPNLVALVEEFNSHLTADAQKYGALVAPVFDAFGGAATPNPNLCRDTWICGAYRDIHPSTQGYGVIASTVAATLDYTAPVTRTPAPSSTLVATPTETATPPSAPTATSVPTSAMQVPSATPLPPSTPTAQTGATPSGTPAPPAPSPAATTTPMPSPTPVHSAAPGPAHPVRPRPPHPVPSPTVKHPPTAHHSTPQTHPLSLSYAIARGRLLGSSVLPVTIHAGAQAPVTVTLTLIRMVQVLAEKAQLQHVVWAGAGPSRHTLVRAVTLIQVRAHSKTNGQGRVIVRLHITFNPPAALPARLVLRVQTPTGTIARSSAVTLLHHTLRPPAPKHQSKNHLRCPVPLLSQHGAARCLRSLTQRRGGDWEGMPWTAWASWLMGVRESRDISGAEEPAAAPLTNPVRVPRLIPSTAATVDYTHLRACHMQVSP